MTSLARLARHNGDISFYEDTGTTPKFFWDASAESLGIGTTLPATYSIDAVKGIRSSGVAPNFTLQETDTGNQTWLMASYAGNFAVRDTTVAGTTYPLQIEPATPSNTLFLDSTGNVGIGTASPQTELEISAAQSPFLRLTSEKDGTHDAGDIYGELQFFTQETYGNAPVVSAKIQSLHTRAGTGHSNGDAGLALFTSTATNDATATERMRIESATGNVGIGTTSPTDKLHLGTNSGGTQLKIQSASSNNNCILHTNGTTDSWRTGMNLTLTNGSYEFYDDVNNVSRMVIDSSGNVGLGVTPNANWSSSYRAIDAFGGATFQFEANSTRQGQNFYGYPWKYKATGTASSIAHTSGGDISFQVAPSGTADSAITWSQAMLIKNTGNVGIGQTAFGVNGKLQVTGGISTTGNSEIRQSTNSDGSTLRFLGTQLVIANSNANGYSYSGGGLVASVSPSAGAITLDVGANNTSGHRLKVINGGDGIQGSLQYLSNTTARLNIDSATGAFTMTPAAGGHAVFNEGSIDADFRVESNDNTHMLFVDGGNNRVGIGKAPATHPLEVGVYAQFDTGMTINETGIDADFRVESNGNTHMLFVNAGIDQVAIGSGTISAPSGYHLLSYGAGSGARSAFVHGAGDGGIVVSGSAGGSAASVIFGNNWGTNGATFNEEYRLYMDGSDDSLQFNYNANANTAIKLTNDGRTNIFGVGSEAASRFTINNDGSGTGHLQFQTAVNTQANSYVRANIVMSRNKDQITWDTTTGMWNHAGGSSTDWSMLSHVSGGFRAYTGGSLSAATQFTNTDFTDNYLSYYVTPTGGHTWEAPGGGGFVFNERGLARDFRVESDNSSAMLFVDASTDRVGVGVSAPTNTFDVQSSDTNAVRIRGTSNLPLYTYHDSSGVGLASGPGTSYGDLIYLYPSAKAIRFYTNGVFRNAFSDTENVFNESGVDTDFRVESDANSHMLFVDGGNNKIGINESHPAASLDIRQSTNGNTDGILVRPVNETQSMIYSFLGMRNTYFTHFVTDSANSGNANYEYFKFFAGTEDINGELLQLHDDYTVFNEGGLDRNFRVESSGNANMLVVDASTNRVGIGVAAPLQTLHVSGSTFASGYYITALQGNAQLTNASTSSGSNPSYIGQGLISVTVSDAKAKENFGPVEENECLNKVVSLAEHVKKFDWIDEDWKKEKGRTVGMVAQEVYEDHSEFVHKPENYNDGGWAIRHQEMVPTLIKAIQEQQELIKTLEARIAALES